MADNLTTPIPDTTVLGTKDLAGVHLPKKVLVDTAGAEVIGVVTASPTANTVLARLKDLLSLIVLAAGSNIIGKVGIDQTTPGTTNGVQVNAALPAGSNTIGTVSLTDISAAEYETVAASATNQALGATGGTGDYLAGLLIVPGTTSPGAVTIKDGSTSPDVGFTVFTGGASSVSNLVPFFVPLGAKSVTGAWYVTTGSNVTVFAVGNFT